MYVKYKVIIDEKLSKIPSFLSLCCSHQLDYYSYGSIGKYFPIAGINGH